MTFCLLNLKGNALSKKCKYSNLVSQFFLNKSQFFPLCFFFLRFYVVNKFLKPSFYYYNNNYNKKQQKKPNYTFTLNANKTKRLCLHLYNFQN